MISNIARCKVKGTIIAVVSYITVPHMWDCSSDKPTWIQFVLVKRVLVYNLGSLSQVLQLFQFDWPKMGHVQAKTCLTGQSEQHHNKSTVGPQQIRLQD